MANSKVTMKRRLSSSIEESKIKVPRSNGMETPAKSVTPTKSAPPREVRVMDFVNSRVAEIKSLEEAIKTVGSSKLIFQKLPRHMRRRAMSHNIKRIPSRLRRIALIEYQNRSSAAKSKPPSRKHRRRPRNLLAEYQRRQRRVRWLETHIWHAKRFKMVERWGWRLPMHPTARGERAAYRAAARHCLLQDISYMCCTEILGPEQDIIAAMKLLFSDRTGPTVAGRAFRPGTRGGEAVLYRCGCFPRRAVAQVSFLWRPADSMAADMPEERQLWLWCHPSCLSQVWSQVIEALGQRSGAMAGATGDAQAPGSSAEDSTETSATQEPSSWGTRHRRVGAVTVTSLRDQLVRFQLTGPVSGEILHEVLQVADVESPEKGGGKHWWQTAYADPKMAACHTAQRVLWDVVSSRPPGELAPHQVVALTVRDPRVLLPKTRCKVMAPSEGRGGNSADTASSTEVCQSPLWREEVRLGVRSSMLSVLELNKEREKLLVPGSPLQLGERESRVPVILVQQPGARGSISSLGCSPSPSPSLGAGWDLVAPGGWGMGFLLALVFRGAKPGGMREGSAIAGETGCLHFPSDFPDTPSGRELSRMEMEEVQKKHDGRPPAKRPNYVKLGVPSPFRCPWELLAEQWEERKDSLLSEGDTKVNMADILSQNRAKRVDLASRNFSSAEDSRKSTEKDRQGSEGSTLAETKMPVSWGDSERKSEEMFVLRERRQLRLLSAVTAPHLKNIRNNRKVSDLKTRLALLARDVDLKALAAECSRAIVPVHIHMTRRGVPEKFAHICLPTMADIQALQEDETFAGPVEPAHHDPGKVKRKEERKEKKKLQKMKKNKKKEMASVDASADEARTEDAPSEQSEKASKLETSGGKSSKLGETEVRKLQETGQQSCEQQMEAESSLDIVDLLTCNSRPILGFVNKGSFALSRGEGSGLGFCSLIGLLHLLQATALDRPVTALVRNPKSFQYRFATLSVLI